MRKTCLNLKRMTSLILGYIALSVLFSSLTKGTVTQGSAPVHNHGVMVWDASCIDNIQKTDKTRIEAPMINEEPDVKQAVLLGALVDWKYNCGHIEVRKDQ